jgi:hypothetical protein
LKLFESFAIGLGSTFVMWVDTMMESKVISMCCKVCSKIDDKQKCFILNHDSLSRHGKGMEEIIVPFLFYQG